MTPRQEAEIIVRRIRAFWARQGMSPNVWTESARMVTSQTDDRQHWVVRSDMKGGRPASSPSAAIRINSGLTADSTSGLAALAGVPHAGIAMAPVRPPQSPWQEMRHG